MSKIKQIAEDLAAPICEKLGLLLYDVEYKKEGADWRLTYYIDKEGGVSLNDCDEFSRTISDVLDDVDPIEQNYILTVSSPGIERRLTRDWHFEKAVGKEVELKFFTVINGDKRLCGILKSFAGESLVIAVDGKDVEVEMKNISSAKLVYHF